jgi:hypothetical protein
MVMKIALYLFVLFPCGSTGLERSDDGFSSGKTQTGQWKDAVLPSFRAKSVYWMLIDEPGRELFTQKGSERHRIIGNYQALLTMTFT